jgi:hypothetical protein
LFGYSCTVAILDYPGFLCRVFFVYGAISRVRKTTLVATHPFLGPIPSSLPYSTPRLPVLYYAALSLDAPLLIIWSGAAVTYRNLLISKLNLQTHPFGLALEYDNDLQRGHDLYGIDSFPPWSQSMGHSNSLTLLVVNALPPV